MQRHLTTQNEVYIRLF